MEHRLQEPFTKEQVKHFKAGDRVLVTGTIYTARDAAHKRIVELLQKGEEPPFDIENSIVYYVGPTPAKPGHPIGSAGPTTSYRMDAYAPTLLDLGQLAMIGKGQRSDEVKEAVVRNGAVYLAAIGGAAALMARQIKSAEVIAFDDLGAEAVRRLYVEDLPLTVVLDWLLDRLLHGLGGLLERGCRGKCRRLCRSCRGGSGSRGGSRGLLHPCAAAGAEGCTRGQRRAAVLAESLCGGLGRLCLDQPCTAAGTEGHARADLCAAVGAAAGCVDGLDLHPAVLDLIVQGIHLLDEIGCFGQGVCAVGAVHLIADLIVELVDAAFCIRDLAVQPGDLRKLFGTLGRALARLGDPVLHFIEKCHGCVSFSLNLNSRTSPDQWWSRPAYLCTTSGPHR